MAELGAGTGSGYPGAIDTDTTQEVNSPNAGKTKARAEVVNDLNSAVVAIETELGTDPAGSLTDVKTFLQTEHGTDGTHLGTKVVRMTTDQTGIAGTKAWTGTQKWAKGADIASAAALTLGTDGNYFVVTGTTTITSIATIGVGTFVFLRFASALTLTHNATTLVLPGAANITTATGDAAIFIEYASGWRCINYMKADGTPLVNSVSNDSITEAKINWANAGGISQWLINSTDWSTTSATLVDITSIPIYIPANANTLEYYAMIKVSAGGVQFRLQIGAVNGTTLTTSNTNYTLSSLGTLDISALSGWQTALDIQLANSGGTGYVREIWVRII